MKTWKDYKKTKKFFRKFYKDLSALNKKIKKLHNNVYSNKKYIDFIKNTDDKEMLILINKSINCLNNIKIEFMSIQDEVELRKTLVDMEKKGDD